MKASKVLKKARKLIKEVGHCKGDLAVNVRGDSIDPIDPGAVAYCSFGAIHKVLNISDDPWIDNNLMKIKDVSYYLSETIPGEVTRVWNKVGIDEYNDRPETTLKDIDRWFKRAVKLAEDDENQ